MAIDYRKHQYKGEKALRDTRTALEKFSDKISRSHTATTVFVMSAGFAFMGNAFPPVLLFIDILLFYNLIYFSWLAFFSRKYELPFRMPKTAKRIDPNNKAPGSGKPRMAEGIMFIGNEDRSKEEIWFTNSDARTHILYLGTTGSGKTEGLKTLSSNALGWGSGFIFVDGKADTDTWGAISALARRFGRDDDLLVLNYMTGNSDNKISSNTVNPFSQGSASYLTNMLVSLMPEVQGDNAMWKDRAVALISALMPVLTWQRNNQEKVLNINTIREALNFKNVIQRARDPAVPARLRAGIRGYLDTLPGYTDAGFNDDGTEKPVQGGPPLDYSTIYQQHGYLSMQFTRQLQSLADDYGYIFETPSADIDMMDVVLNRRILVVLIPALEKSADETANLGKIVGSMLKGMMGATLGSTVEGDTDMALENKPTRSSTPFMAIFDEVGYYTTQGMGVMAAQARSLGFCLVFAAQDLPAMEKRVKEEARSITANCNLKIFGKLEDPTQTREFFEKTVGEVKAIEASSQKKVKAHFGEKKFDEGDSFNIVNKAKASYDSLKNFREGQAVVNFGSRVVQANMMLSNPGKIKSLRVNKFLSIPHPDPDGKRGSKDVDAILERVRDRSWTAKNAVNAAPLNDWVTSVSKKLRSLAPDRSQNIVADFCAALIHAAQADGMLKPDAVKASAAPVKTPVNSVSVSPVVSEVVSEEAPVLQQTTPEITPTPSVAQGTSDTVSWADLMGDTAAGGSDTGEPITQASEQQTAKAPNIDSLPAMDETISWKDLMNEDTSAVSAPPTRSQPPVIPQTSFGFGGFGGLGSGYAAPVGFGPASKPLPQSTSGLTGGGTTKKAADSGHDQDARLKKAAEDGETVNWKDLLQ